MRTNEFNVSDNMQITLNRGPLFYCPLSQISTQISTSYLGFITSPIQV